MFIIDQLPDNIPELYQEVDALLSNNGIQRDSCLDYTCIMRKRAGGDVVATGSAYQNTLRCLAVRKDMRENGLLAKLVEHLLSVQFGRGNSHVFLYTKLENAPLFESLGFHEIVRSTNIAFMENRPLGFLHYCENLKAQSICPDSAAVVMNANPFTLGHQALVEQASQNHKLVHVFMVSEESSLIPYSVRKKLIREGLSHLSNVVFHDSGSYMISNATFPSYFIRDKAVVNKNHAQLDVLIFCRIAKALQITHRYVGEEPTSQVTGIYNATMRELLPAAGLSCVIVPRRTTESGQIISASVVRAALQKEQWAVVKDMVPKSTFQFFNSPEAEPILSAIKKSEDIIHY